MYQEERLYQILELLRRQRSLTKQEIMQKFSISRDTARRDIICLVNEGVALRTHGGIILPPRPSRPSFKERAKRELDRKQKLGKMAAAYIRRNSLCFLDTSTTVESICEFIAEPSTIYSNSIDIFEHLQQKPNLDLHLLGGKLQPAYRYLYGPETLAAIANLHFDICFLGASSITKDGIYTFEGEDALIKHQIAKQSAVVCVLADSRKFLVQPGQKFCNLNEVDILLTSTMPPKSIITASAAANCSLIWDFSSDRTNGKTTRTDSEVNP